MKQFTESEIQTELESIKKPPALDTYGTYPYWHLDDRAFEILLYLVFVEDVRDGYHGDKYDKVTLMTGVGEKGRDVKLLYDGRNNGVVQGKRYQGRFGRPVAAKEIIKFGLYYLLDNSLIADPDDFDYHIAVAHDFTGRAIELLDNFGEQLAAADELEEWVQSVIAAHKSLAGMAYKEVRKPLLSVLSRIRLRKWNAEDLDQRVQRYPGISSRFFALRVVTDLAQTAEVMRSVLAESNIHALTDDDVSQLNQRIASIPADRRFDFGHMQLFGYHVDILGRAADDGTLKGVAMLGARFHQRLIDLVLVEGHKRVQRLVVESLAPRDDVSTIGKEAAQGIVKARFLDKFMRAVQPEFVVEQYQAKSKAFVPPTVDAHVERHLAIAAKVLAEDFSEFQEPAEFAELKIAAAKKIYGGFHDLDECRAVLVQDLERLEPWMEEIDSAVSEYIPLNPTVLFTDSRFFEDEKRMKRIIDIFKRYKPSSGLAGK